MMRKSKSHGFLVFEFGIVAGRVRSSGAAPTGDRKVA